MKVFVYILLLFSFGVGAQSISVQKEVNSLIKGTNTKKLNLYGYFDNKYEIHLYLIHNDSEWAGICYYPSSDTKINLEGGLVKNKLILNESDEDNDNLGMWQIDLNEPDYKAKWMNPSGSVSFDLVMKANANSVKNTMTVDTYEGNIINSKYNIVIYNVDKNIKRANVINLDDARYLSNIVKCKNENCTDFDILMTDDKKIKRLECHKSGNGNLQVDIYNQFITKFTTGLKKINSVKNGDISFMNKEFRYYISFPNIKNKKVSLSKEMEQYAKSIADKMIENGTDDLENRLQLSANGWFDIDLVSKDIFSGILISQKSFDDKISARAINLSLKDGKDINIKDQFKSGFNYNFFINQFLKDRIGKMYKNKSVSKWYNLRPKDFKNITLCKAGIVYSTDFNSIIGSKKIIVPYDEIKDELNRKSILKKIMLK